MDLVTRPNKAGAAVLRSQLDIGEFIRSLHQKEGKPDTPEIAANRSAKLIIAAVERGRQSD
jgi:hypothetical protein